MNSELQSYKWISKNKQQATLQVPLQFNFEPIEIISKQLTKLKGSSPYRIYYLGPRWNNSFLFHRTFSQKHGYEFDIFRINRNNTYFSQTMSQNQFYRNQLYYRAFEGMNPTIENIDAVFDSKFQGGNLDCAIKVNENQFDLFLRIDSNTRGHTFWYNFTVSHVKKGEKIKFNICNFTKHKTLYDLGLKPFVRIVNSDQTESEWSTDEVQNVTYNKKKLRYEFVYEKIQVRELYQLSFEYKFKQPTDVVQFSYCIPYGYTDLCNELKLLHKVAQVQTLGKSLTGVNIPVVKIGKIQNGKSKPVIFITGRAHPSQTNGSIKLSGLMQYICFSPEAQLIRNNLITIIVPMLNPDGVILGNSRTGACGKDLNREFRSKNRNLYPEIGLVKQLISQIQKTNKIQLYLDFHGHSRKKNIFLFGPQYAINQMEYYKARMIPKLLANITSIFRYYSCSYNVPESKKNTARGVMLNQFQIPLVYTVESSIGVYHDFTNHKDMIFNRKTWQSLGHSIGTSIKEYFENIFEYQRFLQNRKNQKNTKKNKTNEKQQKKNNQQKQADIKIFKILTQIKKLDEKSMKKIPNGEDDSDQSDSQDQQDNLEKQKMKQFQGMVTEFVDQQGQQRNSIKENQIRKTGSKRILRRKIKTNTTNDNLLFNELWKQSNKLRYSATSHKVQRQYKSIEKITPSNKKSQKNLISTSSTSRKLFSKPRMQFSNKSKQDFIINPLYAHLKLDQDNSNITFFNFSKMVQNNKVVRYEEHDIFNTVNNKVKKVEKVSSNAHFEPEPNRLNKINLIDPNPISQYCEYDYRDVSVRKPKNAYPVSFYRIKYHQISTKKNRKKKYEQYIQTHGTRRQTNDVHWSQLSNTNRSVSLNISKAHP